MLLYPGKKCDILRYTRTNIDNINKHERKSYFTFKKSIFIKWKEYSFTVMLISKSHDKVPLSLLHLGIFYNDVK